MKRPGDDERNSRQGWMFSFVVGAIILYLFYRYANSHGISAVLNL